MTETRVCTNPACEHHGAEQDIEQFYICGKDKKSRKHICRDCVLKYHRERYIAERTKRLEYAKIIPDDDPETDLVPMEYGGYVRWAVLTEERRLAYGEESPFNGLSVALDGANDDEYTGGHDVKNRP